MAQIGMLVNSQIKKYVTKATKYFPWWDDLNMNCTYGIITLGMLALGTSQALGASRTCTPCTQWEDAKAKNATILLKDCKDDQKEDQSHISK